jgi:hypothetical protein
MALRSEKTRSALAELGVMANMMRWSPSALSDLIEGSLMLKFNKAKRKAEKEMMEQAAGPN